MTNQWLWNSKYKTTHTSRKGYTSIRQRKGCKEKGQPLLPMNRWSIAAYQKCLTGKPSHLEGKPTKWRSSSSSIYCTLSRALWPKGLKVDDDVNSENSELGSSHISGIIGTAKDITMRAFSWISGTRYSHGRSTMISEGRGWAQSRQVVVSTPTSSSTIIFYQ